MRTLLPSPVVKITRRGARRVAFDGVCRPVKFQGEWRCVPLKKWPGKRSVHPLSRRLKEK